jgi:hypothetical protein
VQPQRLSAQELLECSFLAVEPNVVILENDPSHTIVTLQVVFKGSDKLSVKFEFNTVSFWFEMFALFFHAHHFSYVILPYL